VQGGKKEIVELGWARAPQETPKSKINQPTQGEREVAQNRSAIEKQNSEKSLKRTALSHYLTDKGLTPGGVASKREENLLRAAGSYQERVRAPVTQDAGEAGEPGERKCILHYAKKNGNNRLSEGGEKASAALRTRMGGSGTTL